MSTKNVEQLMEIIKNPNFNTYIVIGDENSGPWKMAQAAGGMLSGIELHLLDPGDIDTLRETYPDIKGGSAGIVFSREGKVTRCLNGGDAVDFMTVNTALNSAG